jgi:hypothetical protein
MVRQSPLLCEELSFSREGPGSDGHRKRTRADGIEQLSGSDDRTIEAGVTTSGEFKVEDHRPKGANRALDLRLVDNAQVEGQMTWPCAIGITLVLGEF